MTWSLLTKTAMIKIPGHLAIRTFQGCNGAFNVGRLFTSIGEFVIKDAVLKQDVEDNYRGEFMISEIRALLNSKVVDGLEPLRATTVRRSMRTVVAPLDGEQPVALGIAMCYTCQQCGSADILAEG